MHPLFHFLSKLIIVCNGVLENAPLLISGLLLAYYIWFSTLVSKCGKECAYMQGNRVRLLVGFANMYIRIFIEQNRLDILQAVLLHSEGAHFCLYLTQL